MPVWSPPFGVAPFPMLKAELLLVEFEADPEEIRERDGAAQFPGEVHGAA